MYFKQSDLFWQLSHDFVEKIMAQGEKQKHTEGAFLFHKGDPARHFYILIKGHIRLGIGKEAQVVHTVSHAGECFGWSALLGREAYSASAQCMAPCEVMLFEAEQFNRIIEADPANGLLLMKRLAGILGGRLLQNYRMISTTPSAEATLTFGSGQVIETAAEI